MHLSSHVRRHSAFRNISLVLHIFQIVRWTQLNFIQSIFCKRANMDCAMITNFQNIATLLALQLLHVLL